MHNVMAAQPNIGGALCKSSVIPFLVRHRNLLLTPTAQVPCSNTANIGERNSTAKMQNLLKFAGVPQTRQQISAASWPQFTIVCGHVGEILLFNIAV